MNGGLNLQDAAKHSESRHLAVLLSGGMQHTKSTTGVNDTDGAKPKTTEENDQV